MRKVFHQNEELTGGDWLGVGGGGGGGGGAERESILIIIIISFLYDK